MRTPSILISLIVQLLFKHHYCTIQCGDSHLCNMLGIKIVLLPAFSVVLWPLSRLGIWCTSCIEVGDKSVGEV